MFKPTVEPLLILAVMYLAIYSSIYPQYIFRRFADQYGLHNISNHTVCSNISSDNHLQVKTAGQTSLWCLYISIAGFLSSVFTTLPISVLGDHVGRRPPLLLSFGGLLLEAAVVIVTIRYDLPLEMFFVAAVVHGVGGGFTCILASCFAYVADVSSHEDRTVRIAVGESCIGVGSVVGSVIAGNWIKAQGFVNPMLFGFGLVVLAILHVVFITKEPRSNDTELLMTSRFRHAWNFLTTAKPYKGIAAAMRNGGGNMKYIVPLLVTILVACMAISGNGSVLTIYKQTRPFCWSPVLIGYVQSLSSLTYFISLVTIRLLHGVCGDSGLVFISLLSSMLARAFEGFASESWMLITAAAVGLFSSMLVTVVRSMISRIASADDQGSYFAVIALVESCAYILGSILFNNIYAATVGWYSGFVFLCGAAMFFALMVLNCILFCATDINNKTSPLRSEYEEIPDEDRDVVEV